MIVKINLEKSYNRLMWGFIQETLQDVGLPNKMIYTNDGMHHNCIIPTVMEWRKARAGETNMGIAPGRSHISIHFCHLPGERLAHKIQKEVEVGRLISLKASRGGHMISHLFFADDLIFFAESSTPHISTINRAFGQRVNFSKSQIFFSLNIGVNQAASLSTMAAISYTTKVGRYLGVELVHQRISKHTFAPLLEKFKRRSVEWKSKYLSLARRITLAKCVMSSLRLLDADSPIVSGGHEGDQQIYTSLYLG